MQSSDFSAAAPGELVTISGGHAFIPANLPPSLTLGNDVWRASDAARGALGEFIGQSRRVNNEGLVTLPLLTIEAVESNRIEGTHTQVADVLRQHAAGPSRDRETAERNQEVLLYREALWHGADWIGEGRPISESLIRGLHRELLRTGRGEDANPGQFRNEVVLIGKAGDGPHEARFVPPPPEQIIGLMQNLSGYLNGAQQFPELVIAAIAHYQFETIHPFKDGNGRIGRLLIPLYLMATGVIDRPILYLSVFFEAHRDEYYDHLKRVSTHGDWAEWILFFLEAVRARSVDSTAKVGRILDLRERFTQLVRGGTRSQAALSAVELVMEDVFVTIPKVQAYAQCSYNAAKNAVDQLERLNVLLPIERVYPATWGAPALLDEVYGVPRRVDDATGT